MRITTLIPNEIRSISIIGTSKNAGKTTVLNQLISEYQEANRKIGIVSVGVDGEKVDVWSGLSKPAIQISPDTLVATSRFAIEEAEARFEILEKIKDSSIGHEVYLVRTIKGGQVKLTGTPSLHEVERVLQGFHRYGAEIDLVDGAYDRVASANPTLTDGMILVVGASYHRSLTVIMDRVRELIFRKTLPQLPPASWQEPPIRLIDAGKAVWISASDQEITPLDYPLQRGWSKRVKGVDSYLFLPGSCTGKVLNELTGLDPIPSIVIQDGTRLFPKWEEIAAYYRRGGQIYVRRPIRLLGIAINPTSPDGYQFDSEEMLARIKQISGDLPVFDVVRDKILI